MPATKPLPAVRRLPAPSLSGGTRLLLGLMAAGLSACASPSLGPGAGAGGAAGAASGAGGAGAVAAVPGSPTTAASSAPASASQPPAAAPAAPPGGPPPFALLTRGAQQQDALLPLWRKEDKVWIELRPADFERSFFLSPKLATGIGAAGVYGGLMASTWGQALGRPQWVQFRRVGQQVQLLAVNAAYAAAPGTPAAAAVRAGFSPSLLASAPLASAAHPERQSVLVDLAVLLGGDLQGLAASLQRSYRQPYAHDARHSALGPVRGTAGLLAVEVRNHYAAPSLASAAPGAPPGAPVPGTPSTLPDVRSLFVTVHYSLTALPEPVMRPRRADARLGHFTTTVHALDDELARSPKRRHVNRWRLEKADPSLALSPPRQPITFWIDRNVPLPYRDSIRAGILEWNKAFEAIGFRDAIVVQQQPDDASWDTLDGDRASVRWMTNAEASFGAIGPSHVDPRSGEILDADIAFESLSSRALRTLRAQVLSPVSAGATAAGGGEPAPAEAHDPQRCEHAQHASEQLGYALDVLAARGEIEPDSPEAEAFVQAYLKDVTLHEVGHALGLRHNFRASTVYGEAQLADPAFVAAHGSTGSVMEYAPVHLARAGEPALPPFQTTLGPYDHWAIEYAYKPLGPDWEEGELQRIAARSAEPLLAFATDEDNSLGLDPEAQVFDLGSDPLAHARRRIDIARELLARQAVRELRPDQDHAVLRRAVAYALRDVGRAATIVVRQIGGLRTLRDHPGSGRDPLQPVPAARQREALALLEREILAPDAFPLPPALMRRLAPDYAERQDALRSGAPVSSDFPLAQTLLDLQRSVLAPLMSDAVATRLLDAELHGGEGLRLAELYGRLGAGLWSELGRGGDIPALRRELQREHLSRLVALLLRPAALSRADARSLLRAEAQRLHADIARRLAGEGLGTEARAHLLDSLEQLGQALAAPLQRAAS